MPYSIIPLYYHIVHHHITNDLFLFNIYVIQLPITIITASTSSALRPAHCAILPSLKGGGNSVVRAPHYIIPPNNHPSSLVPRNAVNPTSVCVQRNYWHDSHFYDRVFGCSVFYIFMACNDRVGIDLSIDIVGSRLESRE